MFSRDCQSYHPVLSITIRGSDGQAHHVYHLSRLFCRKESFTCCHTMNFPQKFPPVPSGKLYCPEDDFRRHLTLRRRRVVHLLNRRQFHLEKVCDPDGLPHCCLRVKRSWVRTCGDTRGTPAGRTPLRRHVDTTTPSHYPSTVVAATITTTLMYLMASD